VVFTKLGLTKVLFSAKKLFRIL